MVRLFDSYEILMDDVEYDDEDPWPEQADGEGPTLELIYPYLDNSLAENWAASEGYGSPGRENANNDCDEELGDINGDGVFDVLDIVLMTGIIFGNDSTASYLSSTTVSLRINDMRVVVAGVLILAYTTF